MSSSAWILMLGMLGLFWGGFVGLLWVVLRRQDQQHTTQASSRDRGSTEGPSSP